MADHKHGEMDVTTHEKTFSGFIKFTTYSVYIIIAILIFMAIFAR
ncbi:aa3-type cytochrome c oxidase subunit IV [Cognatishimia sp. MH4019]|nr:aa3-type cytochrome c oxidase subunit IV [Cognatishimia sp. MH4019]